VNLPTGSSRSRPIFKRSLALLAGSLLVTAFAPFEFAWLAPLSLAALAILWQGDSPRQAAWSGFCFGLGLFCAGTYWLYISLNILGGLWPPMALLLMLGLIVAMAAYVALCGYLVVLITPAGSWIRWLLVIPAVWTLTEWLRGWLFTGFPWMSLGYSQLDTVLVELAPVAGVYGVSWSVALASGLATGLVLGARYTRFAVVLIGGLLFGGLKYLGQVEWTEDAGDELRVTLVQGAVPQELKWRRDQLEPTLQLYRQLSLEQGERDLIVWPEAAIPALPFEVPEFLLNLQADMAEQDTQLFTGILTYDLDTGIYKNTLWALGQQEGMYFKRHLVPFGEYFPLPDFAKRILRIMNLPSESIREGAADQPLLTVGDVPVAVTICYEIAYGAEQLRFFPEAQLMVNVSNDAWFGDSIAPHQHLQINRMRARETGRYLLRATNTGVTAVIGPMGQVRARIPQFEAGVLNAAVTPRTGATPYVRWGNTPVLAAMLLSLGLATLLRRRQTS